MKQLGQIIAQKLESIEQSARQTLRDVEAIRGVCMGYAAAMSDFNVSPQYDSGNGFQEIVSEPAIVGKTVAKLRQIKICRPIKINLRKQKGGLCRLF